jgi:hypothetical protein
LTEWFYSSFLNNDYIRVLFCHITYVYNVNIRVYTCMWHEQEKNKKVMNGNKKSSYSHVYVDFFRHGKKNNKYENTMTTLTWYSKDQIRGKILTKAS